MTIDDIILAIIKREGSTLTNDPADHGGRTIYGISENAHPEAWAHGTPSLEQAKAIYMQKYVINSGLNQIEDLDLLAQLVDFAVNSGPILAIMKLQEILHVDQDGKLGPQTMKSMYIVDLRRINNLLVGSRIKMFGRIVSKDPSQIKWLNGWINRALEFIK